MPEAQAVPFESQCLEAIKSLGKTLGQMSLYKIGHPAVSAMLKIAEEHLAQVLAETPQGEISFSFDQDKLIANGRILCLVDQLPHAIPALFNRFKLNSLIFKSGVAHAELAAFCELAASRSDSPAAADPKRHLEERGVAHILLSEAVYAKMGEEALTRALEQKSLEEIIKALVGNAVSDANKHKLVYDKVMGLLQEDIERRVEEVAKPLRAEKTTLQNEQVRAQGVIENMVEGVVMVDEQGKILMMNPVAEEIYGVSLAEAAGLSLADKLGQEHVVSLSSEIATPADRPISPEVKVSGGEDTRRTVRAAGAVVQNEAGKVVGLVSSLTDKAKHRELQRMQRDFVAHVTHELRAPLSSIRAALEILQGEIGGRIQESENRVLASALKNSDRLAELINSILDFSKIESGQMTVHPAKADSAKIAQDAVESLTPWAVKKRVGLSLAVVSGLPSVLADPQRSVQVLVNLISNAIKFTPVGGRITVRVAPGQGGDKFADSERFVEISVSDTGCGIPKSEQKRIFEKFVQIAAGELHVGGTGLGLAIAKALVHLQAGRMWVESEEGKGATFFFTLPAAAGKEEPPPPARAAGPWWKRLLGLKY